MQWTNIFAYDVTSPSGLRWKRDVLTKAGCPTKTRAGMAAGSLNNKGYWVVEVDDTPHLVHRIIFEMHGEELEKGDVVDHIDGNSCNNSPLNLRKASHSLNAKNIVKKSNNTSGVTGVTLCKRKRGTFMIATWRDINGAPRSKEFSVDYHGRDTALERASAYRAKMIELLNNQGAGYTERHGKEG